MVSAYVWLPFAAYWAASALFVRRNRSTDGWGWLTAYRVPEVLGFVLLLHGRHRGWLSGEIYQSDLAEWLGMWVALGGLAFAVWARVHLGKYWSSAVSLKEGQRVVRTGPYEIVRHPIYTGISTGALGTAIAGGTLDGFVGWALILGGYLLKLRREEAVLTKELGEEYSRYREEVPALLPFGQAKGRVRLMVQSPAFVHAALRSERFRIFGILTFVGAFIILNISRMLCWQASPRDISRGWEYIVFWLVVGAYEGGLLWLATRAMRRGRSVSGWVWVVNTIVECSFPTVAVLGQTGDKSLLGPYLALMSGSLLLYALFIILSTLRLSPMMCVLAGAVSAGGYTGAYVLTLHLAPHNPHRDIYHTESFVMAAMLLFGAGLTAAAVARQIREHVVAALQEAETRRKLDRMEQDVRTARMIQMGLLPKGPPAVEGYDIAGWSEPADQTGGDYYDWMELPGGKVLFTIADATGHGIGPALLVAACRAYFRAIAMHGDPLEEITSRVDELVGRDCPDGRFITAAVALLEPERHRLSLYSAGHAPIYLFRAREGSIEEFEANQPPLGICFGCDETSRARVFEMQEGDALVLVTDGFFECANAAGELLGTERLGEAIRRHCSRGAGDAIEGLHGDVTAHASGVQQADDMTVVIIKRRAGSIVTSM
ncbi:MAG: SpoIIE family protein phosphatase [Phycisphaerae bacterium]